MREDTDGLSPQPRGDQVFVISWWKVDEAVDAAAYPSDTAGFLVVGQQRVGIACSRRLPCRKQAFLRGSDVVKSLPSRLGGGVSGHAQNLSGT
jgi:hypothetical protein